MTDWVTARGAAELLAPMGFSRTMSRRILAAGLAGEGVRTTGAILYDASRVLELRERPDVDHLPPPCDRALLEVRSTAGSGPTDGTQLGNAGALVRTHLRVLVERHGFLPLVVTCCGFVLDGGEVIEVVALAERRARLAVRPPGPWFAAFAGRRQPRGPGNPWRLWLQPDPAPGAPRDSARSSSALASVP